MADFSTPVRRYLSAPLHTLQADADLTEAHRRLLTLRLSSMPVLGEAGQPLGVVSRSDLMASGRDHGQASGHGTFLKVAHRGVTELMHSPVLTVGEDDSLVAAATKMVAARIHRVYVERDGRLVGVLSSRDIMRAVQEQRLATPLSAYMSSPVVSVQFDSSLAEAADLLRTSHVRGLLVVDGEWPVGLFTQEEALLATDRSAATPVEEVMTSALLCLDAETPLFRVAAQALATRARRVVAVRNRDVVGILTGLDLARAVAQSQ